MNTAKYLSYTTTKLLNHFSHHGAEEILELLTFAQFFTGIRKSRVFLPCVQAQDFRIFVGLAHGLGRILESWSGGNPILCSHKSSKILAYEKIISNDMICHQFDQFVYSILTLRLKISMYYYLVFLSSLKKTLECLMGICISKFGWS